MSKPVGKSARSRRQTYQGRHRFEHWYVDNQIYFITARCRDRFAAFAGEPAKSVFWRCLQTCCAEAKFIPIVTSLMDNHYHLLGYNRTGAALKRALELGAFMPDVPYKRYENPAR